MEYVGDVKRYIVKSNRNPFGPSTHAHCFNDDKTYNKFDGTMLRINKS